MPNKKHNALYYPEYIPNENWTKIQLLFWDSVNRIVPYPMQAQYGDEQIGEMLNIEPSWSPAIDPSEADLSIFDKNRVSFEKAIRNIQKNQQTSFYNLDYFGVHPNKAPKWVFEDLTELGLAKKETERKHGWLDYHYLVHPEAGYLVLSCLASNIANRRNLSPITDREAHFYFNAANEINSNLSDRPNTSMNASLGILVLETLVPKDLSKISLRDFIDIRNEFSELRRSFHNSIKLVAESFELSAILDRNFAEKKLKESIEEYIGEYKKFISPKQSFMRVIKDWRTQSIGVSLGTLGGIVAGAPITEILIKGAGALLTLGGVIFSNKQKSEINKSYQYIQEINKKIDGSKSILGIKPFVIGIKY